jgi:hypothetical protein
MNRCIRYNVGIHWKITEMLQGEEERAQQVGTDSLCDMLFVNKIMKDREWRWTAASNVMLYVIRGVSKKFGEWYQKKTKQKIQTN